MEKHEPKKVRIEITALEIIALGFTLGASAEFGRILLLKLLAG